MSGHSKWANIKHRKGAQDARKGALFSKLARIVEIAAKEGADPETNFKLKLAIEKARAANVPSNNIEKAIRKGAGLDKEKSQLIAVTYEGFGPGGTALVVEALTDNRNRTSAEIKHLFSQFGGNLASPGAVGWQFRPAGKIVVDKIKGREEELALKAIEAGASDIQDEKDLLVVYTDPKRVMSVSGELKKANLPVRESSITLLAQNEVRVGEKAEAQRLLKLMEVLEEHPDVQEVFSNFDIPDSLLEELT